MSKTSTEENKKFLADRIKELVLPEEYLALALHNLSVSEGSCGQFLDPTFADGAREVNIRGENPLWVAFTFSQTKEGWKFWRDVMCALDRSSSPLINTLPPIYK